MIDFKDVNVYYEKQASYSLKDFTTHIDEGEFVFLSGESGAGKSTFIKLLLREILPTDGNVLVEGIDTRELSQRTIPYFRRKMGVVFQDFRLLPNKDVYENIAFTLEIIGKPTKVIRREVPNILALVNLSDKAYSFPHELSGGEMQRAGIARAIINNPKILIADEPTGNLDEKNSREIFQILKTINDGGTTVIVATHDKNFINYINKRIITLEKGRLKCDTSLGGKKK